MASVVGTALSRHVAQRARLEAAGGTVHLDGTREPLPPRAFDDRIRAVLTGTDRTGFHIALSPSFLACSEAWQAPPELSGTRLARAAPALVEARCAGESLDELAVETLLTGRSIQAVAIRKEGLAAIRSTCGDRPVRLLTSIPAAVAQVFGDCAFTAGGERIEVFRENGEIRWRCYPVDDPDTEGSLRWRDREIPFAYVPAVAAAACDPDKVPNLVHQFADAGKVRLRRLRDPIVNVAAAAGLLLGALGVHFHREAGREATALQAAREARTEVSSRLLPGQTVSEGTLLRALQKRVAESGQGDSDGAAPSALAFWREIGKSFPDPDALGLSLESLDLSPEGGRLSARVPAAKDDPLKNASQLEGHLSQSKKLKTRGDYTVRENQVQVRLRMDFTP